MITLAYSVAHELRTANLIAYLSLLSEVHGGVDLSDLIERVNNEIMSRMFELQEEEGNE